MTSRAGRRRLRSVGLCAAAVLAAVGLSIPAGGSVVTGTAGTDTALAPTESAVTVPGRGPFSTLEITVNQTKNLLNQAVSVTWKGGDPTVDISGQFGQNYLQIMQCWGDDDGTVSANPGPSPEHCAFGAKNSVYGGVPGSPFPPGSLATERVISRREWSNFDAGGGTLDPLTGNLWRDFVAVGGTRIGNHIDATFNPSAEGGVYWQNPFFNLITSNEIAGARTLDNGSGGEFFEVVTGVENSGLGCGQKVEPHAGSKRIPKCWLVVVPRRDAAAENVGTPFGQSSGVVTSPLAPDQWQHRIAVPLEFNPVETACTLGADARRLAGSELVAGAVSSWQPALCATPGLRPYSYGIVSDAGARQQLAMNAPGAPGMYVVSEPLDAASLDPDNPTIYAPLTLSGLTIGFNIERAPSLEAGEDAQRLKSVRVAKLNLTPRLVAKLLTQSYVRQVNINGLPPYAWITPNPDHIGKDEDFLRFNPEFRELDIVWRKHFSGLLLPAGNSDAAKQLWTYVLADPEARTWLDGTPDEWGMRVNPVYATTASANSLGAAFADEPPSNFPKSDPHCYLAPKTPQGVTPPPLCGTDWYPYTQSMRDSAKAARAADDGARLSANAFATSSEKYYSRTPPQPPGERTIMALTDSASASLFGLQTAHLSRAGDNGDDRRFIGPDVAGLTAGVNGMAPKSELAVLEPDPTLRAPSGYPLTTLTYAAIRPLSLGTTERYEYAAFVDYAAGPGQVSGPRYGELPVGYAPLTEALRTQARTAAKAVRDMAAQAEAQPPPTSVDAGAEVQETADGSVDVDRPAAEELAASSANGQTWSSSSRSASGVRAPFGGSVATPAAAPVPLAAPSSVSAASELLELARTPSIAVPATRLVLPALVAIALLAALAALEITKRPRRAITAPAERKE